MKKTLSLLLSLALVFTIAVPASTIHASAASNITYEIDGSTLYINGTGPMEDYKDTDDVPWRYERGLAKGIKKIVIAEGITHIGNRSLGNFSAVETVVLPSTLTSVGEAAFRLSTALKTVDIPAGVTSIGERAFEECISLCRKALAIVPDGSYFCESFASDDFIIALLRKAEKKAALLHAGEKQPL